MSKQMTPPRRRMIEDVTIRNMAVSGQKNHVRAVTNFGIFHGCSPDTMPKSACRHQPRCSTTQRRGFFDAAFQSRPLQLTVTTATVTKQSP
jgi:hypothetical protein